MKYYLVVRKKEASHDLKDAWGVSGKHLRTVVYTILALLGMLLHGGIIITMLPVTQKRD